MKEYLDACCCYHNYEDKMASFHYKNWREKRRGFQCTRAFLDFAHLYYTNASRCCHGFHVLSSFGCSVRCGPFVPQFHAQLLCTMRGAVKCPARSGGCLLRAGRRKEKQVCYWSILHIAISFFFLFCLDKEVWKCGLMAVCSTSLSFEHLFNKGMLQ